jgi:hypothetical protein
MKTIKKILILVAVLLFVYYSILWLLFTFETISENNDSDYVKGTISAFMGALFAFVLYGFGVLIGKIYTRTLKHVNAIALLGLQLNHLLEINNDNIRILSNFVTAIDKGTLCMVNLKRYELDESILRELGNIEFSNEVFNFKVDIYKNNESIATITSYYNDLKKHLLDQRIDREIFDLNIKNAKNDLIFLKNALEEFDQKTEKLIAKSQAMFEFDEPILFWIIRTLAIKGHRSKKFNTFYKKRLSIFRISRQQKLEESIKEIEKIKKRSNEA